MFGGVGLQLFVVSAVCAPSRHGPAVVAARLHEVDLLPRALARRRSRRGRRRSGRNANRNGLRKPHANVSWQIVPGADGPVLQRAVPAPRNGFVGGTEPSRPIRRIFPFRMFRSRDASFAPWQPLSPA